MKNIWMVCGILFGITTLSITMAAVPAGRTVVTDDTALYQNLSEIKALRAGRPDFDGDIARLSHLEPRYREKLPSLARDPRVSSPMKRISEQRYRYSGARQGAGVAGANAARAKRR